MTYNTWLIKVGFRAFVMTLAWLFLWSPRAYAANIDLKQCQVKTFRVTSYYSPLPDQDYYGQHNFAKEVRLNGQWTHGASWRAVFNWMVAAGSNYQFGTKIYFPWWGIGQVEDRGQAIVHKWERNQRFDRIDIWAWAGTEWLRRALSFGVQYIDWYVCPSRAIPEKAWFDYTRFPEYDDFFERMLWVMSLSEWRTDPFVQAMQRYLAKLGYFDPDMATGQFGRMTKASVCAFQQRHIGLEANHPSCGTFGPQTRNALRAQVKKKWITLVPMAEMQRRFARLQEAKKIPQLAITTVEKPAVVTPLWEFHNHLFTQGEFSNYIFTRPFIAWEEDKELRIVQRKLAWLGHYKKDEITWVYDSATIAALYEFQKEQWLVNGSEDPSVRGYFGPGTRSVMNRL